MSTCAGCDRELTDAYLCWLCTALLAETLDWLPHLIGELLVTAYRQDRVAAPSAGRGSGERPLPFKAHATRMLADVRVHLIAFQPAGATYVPAGDVAACEALMHGLSNRAKTDPEIGRMFVVLRQDELRIRQIIDLPKSFRYLGQCDQCGTELYADRAAELWQCPGEGCEASYEVKARMDDLIERSREVVASTSTIATALTSMEYPVTEERIRKWASRGLIAAQPAPHAPAGRAKYYRLGDVLDQLVKQRAKIAERQAQVT